MLTAVCNTNLIISLQRRRLQEFELSPGPIPRHVMLSSDDEYGRGKIAPGLRVPRGPGAREVHLVPVGNRGE
ncbi:hypothetical protein SASPL_100299 [Salvia splendens]|uniref:Uncharacterized protein n=1 Tax=Salvia splendens TaxID=180675 RepID=A0A8X8YN08_SALSN|nr:hypothetical protein SASPL_100299 [Salvia splendens]